MINDGGDGLWTTNSIANVIKRFKMCNPCRFISTAYFGVFKLLRGAEQCNLPTIECHADFALGSITSRCSGNESTLLPRRHGEGRPDTRQRQKSSLISLYTSMDRGDHFKVESAKKIWPNRNQHVTVSASPFILRIRIKKTQTHS